MTTIKAFSLARQELCDGLPIWRAQDIANWWRRWLGVLGHRPLARLFMDTTDPARVRRRVRITTDGDSD